MFLRYHRKFKELASKIYIETLNEEEKDSLIQNIIDYFNETWSKNKKPFHYSEKIQRKKGLKSNQSEAYRKTKLQTLEVVLKNGEISYNRRKLKQLPIFIFQLNDLKLKLNAIHKFIYNDFQFLNTLLLTQSYLFNEESNDIWKLYNQFKSSFYNIALFNTIFEQNLKRLHSSPNTIAFQLSSRLSSVNFNEDDSKTIRKTIENFELKSFSINNESILCPLYSFTPVIEYEILKSVLFINDIIKSLITCKKIPVYVAFAENKLYFLDNDTDKLLNTISIDESIQFVQIFAENDDLMSTGGIIGHSVSEIYSLSINGELNYKKSLRNIEYMRLLSCKHACVVLKNANYFEIMSIKNGDFLLKHGFNSQINYLEVNVDARKILLQDSENILLIFGLKNGEIEILQFSCKTEQLENIQSIPSTGLKLLSCKIDRSYFIDNFSLSLEYLLRFACYFESHCCVFSVQRSAVKQRKLDYTVSNIKFIDSYLAAEYSSSIIDFYQNLILFLLNSCIYIYNIGKENNLNLSINFLQL